MILSRYARPEASFVRQRTGLEPLERSQAPIRTWRPILLTCAAAALLGFVAASLWSLT